MNRDILEAPFAPEQIKQREGTYGKMIDYIEGHAVIKRLNDAFEGAWSFEIIEHQVIKEINKVLVLGRLSAGGISKTQFGAGTITRTRQTGEIVSLADDLKAAATDSLKKCATMLGVGLHLYGAKQPTGTERSSNAPTKETPIDRNRADQSNGLLSAKQH